MTEPSNTYDYPHAPRDETIIDDLHDTKVNDPYRWLEDPDSPVTKTWVDAQNDITTSYIRDYPDWDKLNKRLTDTLDFEKVSLPAKHGDRYYYYGNTGLQNQSVLYFQETLKSEPRIFFDPNLLSEDGTTAVSASAFSEQGHYWVYGLSKGGSDWVTFKIRDVTSGLDLNDEIEWAKFTSVSWLHDESGFFYSRYPAPNSTEDRGTETDTNIDHKIYFHKLNTSQKDDVMVYEHSEDRSRVLGHEITDDGHYFLIYPTDGCKEENPVYYAPVATFKDNSRVLNITKLIDNDNASYHYITNQWTTFYFGTTLNAPKRHIIALDITKPIEHTVVLPEQENVLCSYACVNTDYLLVRYMEDAKDIVKMYVLNKDQCKYVKDIPLPGPGSVGLMAQRKNDFFFYSYTSFLTAKTILKYSFDTHESTLHYETQINGFDSTEFVADQQFATSKDGTRVPLFTVTNKNLKRDGSSPLLLYAYGGFGISIQPFFSSSFLTLLKNLGVSIAIANLRGGGEYGQDWHQAGTKERKQNVFDDFQAVAEYLIDEGYTSSKKLTIRGGSNGGLLVGACINQRPDLYGCAIAQVGVLDMLRFHKFTIGHAWCTDYGCADDKDDFEYLYKYSPLHNVNPKANYPAVLLTTADHDDRVVPLHSYKFISTLQHELGSNTTQVNPLMIRIETSAGHGAGKPTNKIIEESTDMYAFIAKALDLQYME
jgi:prolyl oligopeptidase